MEVPEDLTIDQRLAELIELMHLTQRTVGSDNDATERSLGVMAGSCRVARREINKRISTLEDRIGYLVEELTETRDQLDDAIECNDILRAELSKLKN